MVELSQEDKNRAAKLRQILARLQAGEHVQNRMLQTWLTAEQYERISEGWQAEKDLRSTLSEKPPEISKYEDYVKKANFLDNRADGYGQRGHKEAAAKFRDKAEREYERALEYLQEIIAANPHLQIWFDRDPCWIIDGEAGIDRASIPRVATSRSTECSGNCFTQKRSKNDIKQMVVQDAMNELLQPPKLMNAEKEKKLRKLLKSLDD